MILKALHSETRLTSLACNVAKDSAIAWWSVTGWTTPRLYSGWAAAWVSSSCKPDAGERRGRGYYLKGGNSPMTTATSAPTQSKEKQRALPGRTISKFCLLIICHTATGERYLLSLARGNCLDLHHPIRQSLLPCLDLARGLGLKRLVSRVV